MIKKIAEIAQLFGAKIPFMRSADTANDHAGIIEVLKEVYEMYSARGQQFEMVCCLLPTAPLIKPLRIVEAQNLLLTLGFDSVFPVVRFSYPIWRSFRRNDSGAVVMNWPENYPKRSQDLPAAFHDSGQFYWFKPKVCFDKERLFTDNSGSIEIPETEAQDVDNLEDWQICELKFKLLAK